MKLLMHTCCAPCSVYCIDSLRKEGIEPVVYWYNPNIHPYVEYKIRRDTLKEYTKSINANAIFEEEYGLDNFCKNVIDDLDNRCKNYCYKVRLEQTAKYAKEHGYDTISTTLLVSPYQQHEVLKIQGEEAAKKYGLNFLYKDFRIGFKDGQAKARQLGLYMQKYCGCIFSEEISSLARQKKDKEIVYKANKDTERRIRLSNYVPNLDFRPLKRENKEEIDFIYDLKKQKYAEENKQKLNEDIQNKLLERYIKENAKHIKVITIKGERVGFFNNKILEDNTFRINNIFILKEYLNRGIEKAILNEILFENKDIVLQCFKDDHVVKL
ncbi:MAG: hypothetical protein HFJ59_00985 [Clostridia bacterium]|nr:hypothetical protein [Clostridia bacterium]